MLGTTVLIASILVPKMGGSHVSFCPLYLILIYIKSLFDGLDPFSNLQYPKFNVDANRVMKPVLFKHCSLWRDWIHWFKQWLGRGFLQWWVHHLLTSYPCWQLSTISPMRPLHLSIRYLNFKQNVIWAISLLYHCYRVLRAIWFCVWKRLYYMDYLVNLTIYELLSTNVWENAPNLYV